MKYLYFKMYVSDTGPSAILRSFLFFADFRDLETLLALIILPSQVYPPPTNSPRNIPFFEG